MKFDDYSESLDQSLDLEEVSFMYEYMCVISVYSVNRLDRLDVCIQLSIVFYYFLQFGDQTFGHVVNGARTYYSFALFLETRKENETFKKYNKGGNITPCLSYLLVFIQLFTDQRYEAKATYGRFKDWRGNAHCTN